MVVLGRAPRVAALLACIAAATCAGGAAAASCPTRQFTRGCGSSPTCPTRQYSILYGEYLAATPAPGPLDPAVAPFAPGGPTYYRLTVPRADVAGVCSLGRAGEERETYLPLQFDDGAVRMVQPVAKNGGCAAAARGGPSSPLVHMLFNLLDTAQVGLVECTPGDEQCAVHLYETTGSVGYRKEEQEALKRRRGRALSQTPTCTDCDVVCSVTCGTSNNCGPPQCAAGTMCDGKNSDNTHCPSFPESCICATSNNASQNWCCVPDSYWSSCGCSECFPADAVVTTVRHGATRISALKIGDKVLAARPDGSTFFDDVYMFGHKDTTTAARFVRLETAGGAALRLTSDHHLFVIRGGERRGVPASQALVGDLVHVEGRLGASQLEAIVAKSLVAGTGLFNPYTLSGSIVVDGVAASCHSSSALDGVFRLMGVSVPDGYQAVFAPLRAMYRALGADRMASIEFIIDAVASAINTGTLLSALGPVASAADEQRGDPHSSWLHAG
jgi:hypothetical protein